MLIGTAVHTQYAAHTLRTQHTHTKNTAHTH